MIIKRVTREIYDSQKEDFHTSFATINIIRSKAQEIGVSPEDAVALYIAYAEQSAIQETLESLSNNNFMKEKMGWGKQRITNARKALMDAGVICEVKKRGDGKIVGHYVKIKYLKRVSIAEIDIDHESSEPEGELHHRSGESPSGWLAPNTDISKINTDVSKNINTDISKEEIKYSAAEHAQSDSTLQEDIALKIDKAGLFEEFWSLYPNKKGKARARKLFFKKINKQEQFDELMNGLNGYIGNFNDKTRSGEFVPRYRMGDVFLSKETWFDYTDYKETTNTLAFATEKAIINLDIKILHDFLISRDGKWNTPKGLAQHRSTMGEIFRRVEELGGDVSDPSSRNKLL